MGFYIPDGSIVSIATAYDTADTMSAISNAADAVATLASSHGNVVGDILEITSGWPNLNGRIARVDAVSVNDVTLDGINTANTTRFSPGAGAGSVRRITSWVDLSQIVSFSPRGGEQKFDTVAFLEETREREIPTSKSAQGVDFEMADDMALPWYAVLVAADEGKTPRAVRVKLPTGAVIYYNAFVSFNTNPMLNKSKVAVLKGSLSFAADLSRYAA